MALARPPVSATTRSPIGSWKGFEVGDIVRGYYLDTGTAALRQGMHVAVVPNAANTLRVQSINVLRGKQVWVEPVLSTVTVGSSISRHRSRCGGVPRRRCGSSVCAGMTAYRWSLSFGDLSPAGLPARGVRVRSSDARVGRTPRWTAPRCRGRCRAVPRAAASQEVLDAIWDQDIVDATTLCCAACASRRCWA